MCIGIYRYMYISVHTVVKVSIILCACGPEYVYRVRGRRHGEGKFSKASALVYFLCKITVERTFENVYHRLRDRRQGDGTRAQPISQL